MRYILLIILNAPIVLLAFMNIITQYKLKKNTRDQFRRQIIVWITITLVLFCSFPIYNLISGRPIFQSDDFSAFDIIQTTVIVYLIYLANHQHQRLELQEKRYRDLHQKLSIKLSKK